jgi:outer membrane protein assembly factor BamB
MRIWLACLAMSGLISASDWPRYRGPNGAGVSSDRDLPPELSKDKNLLWRTAVAKGNSSPVVVGGRLFITGHEGDQRAVFCLDAKSGKLLWRQFVDRLRNETVNPLNGPTTPSVATDGRLVFSYFPEMGLVAHDFGGGERWRVPLGPFGSIQGMATSPVYVAGKVMLLVDTPEEAFLLAVDAETGRQAWKVERPVGFLGSYTTPSTYRPAQGPEQLVVAGAVEVTGYDVSTGKRVWWATTVTHGPAALPLVDGNAVYTVEPSGEGAPSFGQMLKQFDKNSNGKVELDETSGDSINERIMYRVFKSIDKHVGDNDGAVTEQEFTGSFASDKPAGGLVRTELGGSGDVTRTNILWRQTKGMPYVTAPLLYEGVLYVVRNGGILATYDPRTGKRLGEARLKDAIGDYYASPVAGAGKIYFVNKEGNVSVVKAGAKWDVLSTTDLGEQVIATPAIADGRIYIRTDQALYCFGNVSTAKQ